MLGRYRGYALRDYESVPEFSAYPEFDGERLPRSQWKERIDYLNSIGSQPVHFHKRFCKIKNQRSSSLCWCYGTISAVENAYAVAGVGGLDLNAYAVGYRGKGTDRRGGFGVECCNMIQQFGIPQTAVLPEYTKTRRWSNEVQQNADKHKMVSFMEIGRRDLDRVVSALLMSQCAITVAFDWWRHLVVALGVAYKGSEWGLIVANSWGTRWSQGGESGGYGIIWGKKAIPFEAVAVKYVKAREEE